MSAAAPSFQRGFSQPSQPASLFSAFSAVRQLAVVQLHTRLLLLNAICCSCTFYITLLHLSVRRYFQLLLAGLLLLKLLGRMIVKKRGKQMHNNIITNAASAVANNNDNDDYRRCWQDLEVASASHSEGGMPENLCVCVKCLP